MPWDEQQTPRTKIARRHHVAVIGCGVWGRHHVRTFEHLGVLHAVADTNPETVRDIRGVTSVPARPVDELLDDPAIDAVVLATPASTHASLALRCIDAGKHVLVEKPLALSVLEAQAVADAAHRQGRIAMVGHLLRYHRAYRTLKEFVSNGHLGRLRYIDAVRLNFGRFRTSENSLWSFAPHDVSMILDLTEEEPERVESVGSSFLRPGIADVTTTHMHFSSGTTAHVHVSWLHPAKEHRLTVVGEDAMVVFDDGQPWARKLTIYRHAVRWVNGQPQPDRSDPQFVTLEPSEPLLDECRHFLACVANNNTPDTDAAEGVRVLRVLDEARTSMRTSREHLRATLAGA